MKHSLTPTIFTAALTAMIAAGASHWWSVRQFAPVAANAAAPMRAPAVPDEPRSTPESMPEIPVPAAPLAAAPPAVMPVALPQAPEAAAPSATHAAGEPIAMQLEFYEEMLREMRNLRGQNRDLLNQVAETNRDLMKLEFRVDTHSDQFRPLPVAEEAFNASFGTSFDDSPGLLPPRAEPVELPSAE